MFSTLSVLLQYLLPKHAITRLAGKFAQARAGWLTTFAIRRFVRHYRVNMNEALNPDIHGYQTFNDFFTRLLQPDARPLAQADYICPIDGSVSQVGTIAGDRIFQAKGHRYSTLALVGGDATLAARFRNGRFATLYLSPKDYHRVHMPCNGRLVRMIYIPGTLFSVNPGTVRGVGGLFARNERVVCLFDSESGPFLLILVGATIVGSIATTWQGVINPRPSESGRRIREWTYGSQDLRLKQGEEMGLFQLGSTVVMLFPENHMLFNPAWTPGRTVQLGESMATVKSNGDREEKGPSYPPNTI